MNSYSSLSIAFGALCGMHLSSLINCISYCLPKIIEAQSIGEAPQAETRFSRLYCKKYCCFLKRLELTKIFSFLIKMKRYDDCHPDILLRYLIVEIMGGIFGGWVIYQYGMQMITLWPALFILFLLAAAVIDAKSMLLPDILTLPLLWLGLLANLDNAFVPLQEAVLGAMFGYLILFVIALAYEWIAKKEGLGGGDMKLLAALGAWLGWQNLMPVLFVAASMALIVGIAMFFITKKSEPAPFGPYLAASGVGFFMYLF